MSNKIIKIDMDGVIRDILTPMCNLYNEAFKTNLKPEDITDYDVNVSFPLIRERWNMDARYFFFDKYSREVFYENSFTFPNVKLAIDKLKDNGYRIIICTYQPHFRNKKDTIDFLFREGILYDDLMFTDKKYLVKGDIIVDDNPVFLNNEDEHNTNCKTVCISAPYNMKYSPSSRLKFSSLNDFVDFLLIKN